MDHHILFRAALAALLVCLALSGCGQTARPNSTEPPELPATTAPAVIIETTAPSETTAAAVVAETEGVAPLPVHQPEETDLVRVADYIPGIRQELPYATEKNFTGQVVYSFSDAYLRYGTVKKLAAVQEELEGLGLSLKIWDGFRPVAAQWKLWQICPDPTYVSDPTRGYSSHSRGNTVDITLTDQAGVELEMPTGFDDFTPLADRDYSDCPETAAENGIFLQNIMEKHGFSGYFGEWWHFSDTTAYDVAQEFSPVPAQAVRLAGEESVPLLASACWEGQILAWLDPGETLTVRAVEGEFALADCRNSWGYVPIRSLDGLS